jgi:hypothetical protein
MLSDAGCEAYKDDTRSRNVPQRSGLFAISVKVILSGDLFTSGIKFEAVNLHDHEIGTWPAGFSFFFFFGLLIPNSPSAWSSVEAKMV